MRKILMLSAAAALCACGAWAQDAAPIQPEYTSAIGEYFEADNGVVQQVAGLLESPEDLPVAFFLARHAGQDPAVLAGQRASGQSWLQVMRANRLEPDILHMAVRGFVLSPIFQPIFDKFDEDNPAQWSQAQLTDRDVVNLVNLRFIADQYDYSIYRVMVLRDKGNSYVQINQNVLQLTQAKDGQQKAATAGF